MARHASLNQDEIDSLLGFDSQQLERFREFRPAGHHQQRARFL